MRTSGLRWAVVVIDACTGGKCVDNLYGTLASPLLSDLFVPLQKETKDLKEISKLYLQFYKQL